MQKREAKKRVAAAVLASLLASTMVAGAVLPQAYAAEAPVQEKPGNVSDALDALAKAAEEEEKKTNAEESEDNAYTETESETEKKEGESEEKKRKTEEEIVGKNDDSRPGKSFKSFLIEAAVVFAAMFFISQIFLAFYAKNR